MNLTQRLWEFGSRRCLLNTFTVKLTEHTVNSFESIRSRWCLVAEDGVSSHISSPGTVTPYRLSHIPDWLVNRSAVVCECTCACTTAGDFVEIFVCCWIKMHQSSHGSIHPPISSPLIGWWVFNRQLCCSAHTAGLPQAVKPMLPAFKYFPLLILGGLSILSHFISQEEKVAMQVFSLYLWKILFYVHSDSRKFYFSKMWPVLCVWVKSNSCLPCLYVNNDFLFLIFLIWHALHLNVSHSGEPSLTWPCQVEFAGGFHVPRGGTIILGF